MNVNTNAKTNLEACASTIKGLEDYRSKNWAIGMTGDTLQPDHFLAFFFARDLPFQYYVRSPQGVTIGDSGAYQANIDTIAQYMDAVKEEEEAQVSEVIKQLKDYQSRNWAIGLNGDTLQPDNFMVFFAFRGLPFSMYVRKGNLSIGDASAYEANIETLTSYLAAVTSM